MRITYAYTLEDLYELTLRERRRHFKRPLDTVKSLVYWSLAYVPLAAWIVSSFGVPGSSPLVVMLAGACGMTMWVYDTMAVRTRIYDYNEHLLGGRGPFSFEVELTPDAMMTRSYGVETRYPWSTVTDVAVTELGVEFAVHRRGYVMVQPNAFATTDDRDAFVQCAREYMSSAAPRP